MKAVFFHDCKLKLYNEKYYTNGGLNREFLKNYLNYCDSLTIVTRLKKEENLKEESYSLCNQENVNFDCVNSLNVISLLIGNIGRKIEENMKKADYAIIRLPSFIGYKAAYEANKLKKPYLVELVGCPFNSLWYQGRLVSKIIAPISYLLNKYFIKKASHVCYVTEKFLQKRYPTKGKSIGCSDVNLLNLEEENIKKRLERINNLDSNTVIKFGIIGPLNMKYKGQDIAIKALSKLKDHMQFELHLLGIGSKERLEKKASKCQILDKVYFDGVLPGGQAVYEWMDKIDIFLVPSLTEGLPRALIEAMSRASVIIGSDVGGIPELIGKEYIFKSKNERQLKNKIEQVIKNKEKMKECARENFQNSLHFEKKVLYNKKDIFLKNFLKDSIEE